MSEIIRDAIAQHLAQQEAEGGAFVTGFVCMAEYLDSDGDQAWLVAFPDGQTVTTFIRAGRDAAHLPAADHGRQRVRRRRVSAPDNICPTCGRECPVDRMPHKGCEGWPDSGGEERRPIRQEMAETQG